MVKLVKISDITRAGKFLADSLRSRYKWSRQLRKAVKLHSGEDKWGAVSIRVTVGEGKVDNRGMGDRPLSGMARAYESGSEAGTYKVSPRRKPFLQFRGTNEYAGQNIRISRPVNHPRMKKRGDIQAAIDSTREKIVPELRLAIRKNLIESLNITIKEVNKR